MSRRTLVPLLVILAVAGLSLFWPSGEIRSQADSRVFVTNFPDLQKIEGTVSVEGPVKLSAHASNRGMVVVPVRPTQTTRLIEGGVLETKGFSHVVLSLVGLTKGQPDEPGTVGAILIPDEETILNAFHEKGRFLFPLEVAAQGVSAASPYFSSDQPRFQVGFSSYRVFLYNTTDKSVEVDFHAYLTN